LITFNECGGNILPINEGYARALREVEIQSDPCLVAAVRGFRMDDGAEGARQLIRLMDPPTALFAIADMLALGAMSAIKEAGLRIPHDIALTSFNDIPIAGLVDPPLTTVAAPAREMGLEAMNMLQSLIAGKRPAHKTIRLPTTLVIRQSCGVH
jgi:LacI family xylobiose transport system transcriptional regulator